MPDVAPDLIDRLIRTHDAGDSAAHAAAITELRKHHVPPSATHAIPAGQSSDAIAATLKDGQSVAFAGAALNRVTIRPRSSGTVFGTSRAAVVTLADKGRDAILIPQGVANVAVHDLGFDVPDKGKSGVSVGGDRVTLTNLRHYGVGQALKLDGATNVTVDGLYHTNGTCDDYAVYFTYNGRPNVNISIVRADLRLFKPANGKGGQHVVRAYGGENVTLGDPAKLLTSGPGAGFSVFLHHSSGYDGCAGNFKSGTYTIRNVLAFGCWAHGDNRLLGNLPALAGQRVRVSVKDSQLNVVRYFRCGAGSTSNVAHTTIRAVAEAVDNAYDVAKLKGDCLTVDEAWPTLAQIRADNARRLRENPARKAAGKPEEPPIPEGLAGAWAVPWAAFTRTAFVGERIASDASLAILRQHSPPPVECTFTNPAGRTWRVGPKWELL